MTEGNTLLNGLIGGVVAVLTAPIFPISPVAGGAVGGYLEGGKLSDGALVGAIAGGIALVPILFVIGLVGGFAVLAPTVGLPGSFSAMALLIAIFGLAFFAVYSIGFAALGGVVGSYVKTETGIGS